MPEARDTLLAALKAEGSAVVALSGGVDSATLAVLSHLALGERSLAVTGVSASLSRHQQGLVESVLRAHPMPHEWLATDELASADYRRNGADRCFHCKNELYGLLREVADARGFAAVLDGTNAGDVGDIRPGRRAAALHGVRSPFLEAGIGKAAVRALARELGLPVAEEPASACLASRVPGTIQIDAGVLNQVEAGEAALREFGFSAFRVRHHGDLARIELPPGEIPRALSPQVGGHLAERLLGLGYRRVAVDLRGYRPAGLAAPFDPDRDLAFLSTGAN
ncbi:MAG: ATP-dependent sacrificial sulfur transferase LarE [Acidobacteriota bacterium]|nr:ATP-dependent sacrificial sulfur transferase LarE [Acidobacteriota bacterium]